MEYRKLGTCGVKVSPICLGTAFRGFMHGQSDEENCVGVIRRAVELGINFIDCANCYSRGGSEQLLGKALRDMPGKRDELVITTKVCSPMGECPNDAGLSRYAILREIDRSLQRLQLDHIDLYLLHSFDDNTPLEETLRAVDDVVRQGKARYIGACNFTAAESVEALWVSGKYNLDPLACLQNEYHLLHRHAVEPELLSRCRQHGFGMMTYSPLAVGILSGHFRRGQPPLTGSFWDVKGDFKAAMTERHDRIVQVLIEIAAELGKTPAQVAIAWILDHPEVTAVISGPDQPEHIEEVCGAVGWQLPEDARQVLDSVSAPQQRYWNDPGQ